MTSVTDRTALRELLLLVGLTRRWRGLASIARHVCHESDLAAVREVLAELVAEGEAEHEDGYADGSWRLTR